MSSDNYNFAVYTENVHARDEEGNITTPDRLQTRSPCALGRELCHHHRDEDRPNAPLPAPSERWTAKLRRRAKDAFSAAKAPPPKPNKDLAIICTDFRYPVEKRSHRLAVLAGLARPVCCLLVEVQVRFSPGEHNRRVDIDAYLTKVYNFVRSQRGTVAIEFKLKVYVRGNDRILSGNTWVRNVLTPGLGIVSSDVRHADVSLYVEQQEPPRLKVWRFKGSRQRGSDEFRGRDPVEYFQIQQDDGSDLDSIQVTWTYDRPTSFPGYYYSTTMSRDPSLLAPAQITSIPASAHQYYVVTRRSVYLATENIIPFARDLGPILHGIQEGGLHVPDTWVAPLYKRQNVHTISYAGAMKYDLNIRAIPHNTTFLEVLQVNIFVETVYQKPAGRFQTLHANYDAEVNPHTHSKSTRPRAVPPRTTTSDYGQLHHRE
ncbi:hypothetical protein BC567DRAFT_213587 [Phyllosticta citribraziliensis]